MELLGVAEVSELFGVTKQVVTNWKTRKEGFPRPMADLKSGPVWSKNELVMWAKNQGLEIRNVPQLRSRAIEGPGKERYAPVAALMNMKGGVGKSTITANVGWVAAWDRDLRVLLIDLDPQFNLSQYILGPSGYEKLIDEKSPTISAVFDEAGVHRDVTIGDIIVSAQEWDDGACLDVVPASLDLAWAMRYAVDKAHKLRDQIARVRGDYDIILIDCSPTESILTTAAYLAADYVFVPVRPEFLSTIGLPLLLRSMKEFKKTYIDEEQPEIGGIIFNDSGEKSEHTRSREYVSDIAEESGWPVFKNALSHSDSYATGARSGRPIFLTDNARSWKKEELRRVAGEFLDRMGI